MSNQDKEREREMPSEVACGGIVCEELPYVLYASSKTTLQILGFRQDIKRSLSPSFFCDAADLFFSKKH